MNHEDEPRARRAIAEGADVLGHVDVAAHAVGTLGDGAAVVLVVVLAEGGEVPPLGGHQAVGQAGDVLARHLGDVEAGYLRGTATVGDGGTFEGAEHVVQRKGMDAPDAVVHGQRGIPILVGRFVVLVGLLAGAGQGLALSQPVVLPRSGVDVLRQVVVIIGGEDQVEPLGQEVALAVLQRGDKGMSLAVLLPEDDVLVDAGLYFLIIIGPGEAQHQAVGPRLARHAQLANHCLVVETVIETLDVINLAGVGVLRDAVVAELGDVVVDVIVIVRQVLEGVDLMEPYE